MILRRGLFCALFAFSFVVFDQPFELAAPLPESFLQRDENVVYFCLYLLFIIGQVACRYIDKSLSAKSQQVISISRVRTYTRNYRRGLPFQEYTVYKRYNVLH